MQRGQEVLGRKWFGQTERQLQGFNGIDVSGLARPRNPDNPDRRVEYPQGRDEGRSVHLWHQHIGQHQLDFLPMFLEDFDGLGSISGCDHPVSELHQCLARDLSYRRLVVHHQDAFAVCGRPGRG